MNKPKLMVEFTCMKCCSWDRTFTLDILSHLWIKPPYDAGPYCPVCASNEGVRAKLENLSREFKGLLLIWGESKWS